VLNDTATPCQLAGCLGLKCSLGTVGRGLVFGVKADSKRIVLALNMMEKSKGKSNGSVEWR